MLFFRDGVGTVPYKATIVLNPTCRGRCPHLPVKLYATDDCLVGCDDRGAPRPLSPPSDEGGGKTAGFDGGSEQHTNSHRLAPASPNIKNLLSLIALNSIITSDRTLPSDNKPQFLYILCRRLIL